MSATKHSGYGKSKFVQTCNRLSLYLREKGNLRDLSHGINSKFEATGVSDTYPVITPAEAMTVDLLKKMEYPGQKAENIIIPECVILDSSCEIQDSTNKASSSCSKSVTKPKTTQMTIFYGGKVLVVDDVTADRARDVMLAAQNGLPINAKTQNRIELASNEPPINAGQLRDTTTKDSDLPIARRASLHKFLAKRKDRAAVRAPYQVHNMQSPGGSSSGNDHSFDLNT